jgi:sulfite reductase (NADPH) flavoprotein alpha-component
MMAQQNIVPCLPVNAPFSTEQRAWINGFLAGVFSYVPLDTTRTSPAPSAANDKGPLLILWGSQTGTAEGIAKKVGKEATTRGHTVKVLDAAKYAEIDWAKEKRVLLVTSTWGDGEPPDNALAFWNALTSSTAPNLAHLEYAVLALGDKNYSSFCGAGKKFDERFVQLGARRLVPCAECDVDYEPTAKVWLEQFWNAGGEAVALPVTRTVTSAESGSSSASESGYSKTNPFPGVLLAKRLLNGASSAKETRHFEFSLEGSGLEYSAGDALGIWPSNDPALVDAVVTTLKLDAESPVSVDGGEISLREALLKKFEITRASREAITLFAEKARSSPIAAAIASGDSAVLEKLTSGWDLLDLVHCASGAQVSAEELLCKLKKLQPRLYSISSSPKAHAGQVHLTVSIVRYVALDRWRGGVCSTYLADRLPTDTPASLFVHKSPHFRLPTDAALPVIMVGPGTGIAPFRAFLNERQAIGATGKNWLFFGDQRRISDFLYQDEIEQFIRNGSLHQLDLAFSRDQEAKVYVQDKMRERGPELWKWLEEGAHFYVCGDAKRMAKDVDAALHEIIENTGGLTRDTAAEYVQNLKSQKRYQRDVY